MSKLHKMCYDRILPRDLRQSAPEVLAMRDLEGHLRAIMPIGKRWPNGTKLSIRFVGGHTTEQTQVAEVAAEWEEHANIILSFDEAPDAQIRIAFEDDGAWSYLGTDNLDIPRHAATMNFGFLDKGTILHEFGHALGLSHEHQNPDGGIQWNESVVIEELSGPPNFWDEATIRHNVFKKYSVDQINGTRFDHDSIMLYSFPAEWTLNNVATDRNSVLSEIDRTFISSVYPKENAPEAVELPVNEVKLTSASIKAPGEEDLFTFKAGSTGTYIIETKGRTDVVMKLFGPDNGTALISEDDDSGQDRNARIERALASGKYLVQVRHFNTSRGTGDYSISVSKK